MFVSINAITTSLPRDRHIGALLWLQVDPTPSATALALRLAISAATEAESSKKTLILTNRIAGAEPGKRIVESDIPKLYDIFESCMVATTCSFQALEVFCNSVIGRRMTGIFTSKRKNLYVALNSSTVERQLSTDEQLAGVLPELVSVKEHHRRKIKESWLIQSSATHPSYFTWLKLSRKRQINFSLCPKDHFFANLSWTVWGRASMRFI
jgi:hypothetical protein